MAIAPHVGVDGNQGTSSHDSRQVAHEPLDNQIDLPLSPYIISNIPNVGKHEKRNSMKIKYITTQPRIIHLTKDKANEKPQQRHENENPEENTFGSSHNHHNCSLRGRTNSRNKFNSTKTKRNPNFANPLPSPSPSPTPERRSLSPATLPVELEERLAQKRCIGVSSSDVTEEADDHY